MAKNNDMTSDELRELLRQLIDSATMVAQKAAEPPPMPPMDPAAAGANAAPSATGIQNLSINAPSANGAQPAVPPLVA